jgi:quinol-cytochrome oxidoreductase complex cytochrome b subunit
MKKLLSFLSYLPVILVGILGAYIVFHMWLLTEIGHGGSAGRKNEQAGKHAQASGKAAPSVSVKGSDSAEDLTSTDQH